jgi:hypothetical protein
MFASALSLQFNFIHPNNIFLPPPINTQRENSQQQFRSTIPPNSFFLSSQSGVEMKSVTKLDGIYHQITHIEKYIHQRKKIESLKSCCAQCFLKVENLLITFTFPNTFSELKWNSRNFLGFLFRT